MTPMRLEYTERTSAQNSFWTMKTIALQSDIGSVFCFPMILGLTQCFIAEGVDQEIRSERVIRFLKKASKSGHIVSNVLKDE